MILASTCPLHSSHPPAQMGSQSRVTDMQPGPTEGLPTVLNLQGTGFISPLTILQIDVGDAWQTTSTNNQLCAF
jgi:hypothetical protein